MTRAKTKPRGRGHLAAGPVDPVDEIRREGGVGKPYRGGGVHRTNRSWQPLHRSEDAAIADSWDLLLRRTRDMARNDGVAISVAGTMADHIVGDGIATYADALVGETYDDEFNDEADELYAEWCEQWACASGQMSRSEMERLIIQECCNAGECFEVRTMIPDGDRPVPLAYQLVQVEQLDELKDWPRDERTGVECRRGIEYDRYGRPLAYHFLKSHPYDFHGGRFGDSVRVPASQVRHYWHPRAISQGRGVSWFATLMQPARDCDLYIGNELTAGIINSLFTVLYLQDQMTDSLGLEDGSQAADSYGNSLVRLGKGLVAHGSTGDDIKVIDPKRPNASAGTFVSLLWQYMAMGARMSYLRLTRDYSKTNYSSARAAHLDDQATFAPLQGWFARRVSLPTRREWTRVMAGLGRFRSLPPAQFAEQPRWLRLEWYPDGRPQIDPQKEVGAIEQRLRIGISTLQEEIAQYSGQSWRRVLRQRKREFEYLAQLGLDPPVWQPSSPAAVAEEDDEPVGDELPVDEDDEEEEQ